MRHCIGCKVQSRHWGILNGREMFGTQHGRIMVAHADHAVPDGRLVGEAARDFGRLGVVGVVGITGSWCAPRGAQLVVYAREDLARLLEQARDALRHGRGVVETGGTR